MKKFLRVLGFVVLTPLCIYWMLLAGFHTKEFFKGNKYVAYLNKNKTVFNSDFQLDASFYDHQLYMVGEIHGFEKSPEIDFKLFKHLNQRIGVRYYMSEVDYSQAYFLNTYLQTGQDSLIHYALKNWMVYVGRNNKDYYQKWKNLYAYNKTLPPDDRIVVLGCDVLMDKQLFIQHIKQLIDEQDFELLFGNAIKLQEFVVKIKAYKSKPEAIQYFKNKYGDKEKELAHLFNTALQTETSGREQKLFDNFKDIYNLLQLENEKIYAFYGLYHTLQSKMADGFEPFASKIKKSELAHASKMVSLNMCFQDSKMIMPSSGLPGFLQTGPQWSEVAFKYDSLLLFYLEGIKDVVRTSGQNTTTFYKLNGKDSPYFHSERLMSVKMILPFLKDQKIEINRNLSSTDYAQYLIFVRNSEAAQPNDI
jgi:hypothetical protein